MNLNEAYNQIDPHASHAQAFELGWNAALENQWQPIVLATIPRMQLILLLDNKGFVASKVLYGEGILLGVAGLQRQRVGLVLRWERCYLLG